MNMQGIKAVAGAFIDAMATNELTYEDAYIAANAIRKSVVQGCVESAAEEMGIDSNGDLAKRVIDVLCENPSAFEAFVAGDLQVVENLL